MPTKTTYLYVLSILFLLSCRTQKSTVQVEPKIYQTYQGVIDSIFHANPTAKGIIAHVESPNKNISWSGASGFDDNNPAMPLDKNQPVLIASSIKTIVSATILKLIENGQTALDKPIKDLLTEKSKNILRDDGYNLDAIQIKHLLSHTSGIEDYINKNYVQTYLDAVNNDKKHRWTRDEQIALTVKAGDPLGKPGAVFNYADANFLLLTEIIEFYAQKPFYTAIRDLVNYEKIGMNTTWFYTLESKPANSKKLAHQYWSSKNWDSYDIDPSFDLYGGGGIACTANDLAKFSYNLFNRQIIKDKAVLNLIYTKMPTDKNNNATYYMGLTEGKINNLVSYGHGGFWGTVHQYVPALNASVVVYILERDQRALRKDVLEGLVRKLK